MLVQLSKDQAERLDEEEILEELGTSLGGLSKKNATRRLEAFGPNTISPAHGSPLGRLLSGLWGPLPWMLEAAAALSLAAKHWPEFAVVSALLLANLVAGVWEDHQATKAVAALKANLAPTARLLRAGVWSFVSADQLVPGDIIRLRRGDIVPAEAYLLRGKPIEVDQSAVTGESLPVTRKPGQTLCAGTVIHRGELDAVVHATGSATELGKTVQAIRSARLSSQFERAMARIGNYTMIVASAMVSTIVIVAVVRDDSPSLATLQFALVLAVATIPVTLPRVLGAIMSLGVRHLSTERVVVDKPASIENLAGLNMLFSDKSGTLTEVQPTVGKPVLLNGAGTKEVLEVAALASRADDRDPIDRAVLAKSNIRAEIEADKVLDFRPFDAVRKRTEALVRAGERQFLASKGAPYAILDLVENRDELEPRVKKIVEAFAARGSRALGVARADEGGKWRYLGLLPLHEPSRADSARAIANAAAMGVQVKMVTGDQVPIAREVAREVGLGDDILHSELFAGERRSRSREFAQTIERADGFAQVYPEHKRELVSVMQQRRHLTGMTGDAVNDAAALKQADVGIAVCGATEAARAAADIVLLSPGLSVIIDAIGESRRICQRMISYATYRLAETIHVLLFMALSILVFDFYPVTTVMIGLLALLNESAVLSIATDNALAAGRPAATNARHALVIATLLGVTGLLASFGMFDLGRQEFHLDGGALQTLMYLQLSAAGQLTIFLTRSRRAFWSSRPSGTILVAVGSAQGLATLFAVYGVFMTPLGWSLAGTVWGYTLVWFLLADRLKLLLSRLLDGNAAIVEDVSPHRIDDPASEPSAAR